MKARKEDRLLRGAVSGVVIFWVVYLGIKLLSIPFLIASLMSLVEAVQHDSVPTYDFGPLIISLVVFLVL